MWAHKEHNKNRVLQKNSNEKQLLNVKDIVSAFVQWKYDVFNVITYFVKI